MPTTISKIFIDTNVFVATRDLDDSTHKKAVKISDQLNRQGSSFYTSSDVIAETLTVLSKKLGKAVVNDWSKDFQRSEIKEIFVDEGLHGETRKLFLKVKSKNVSFVDCSSVVAMKRNKIGVIFSFDEDFRTLGVKLVGDVLG